jgi:two-component system LytT family sensor kinase
MKYSKIELWVSTVFFILILFSKIYYGLSDYGYIITRSHLSTDTIFNQLLPRLFFIIVTYCGFLVLNFYVLPKLWWRKMYPAAIGATLGVLIGMGLCFMVIQSYQSSWIYDQYPKGQAANMAFFSRGFSTATLFLLIYGVYILIREGIIYQYNIYKAKQNLSSRILREIISVVSAWLALLFPVLVINGPSF